MPDVPFWGVHCIEPVAGRETPADDEKLVRYMPFAAFVYLVRNGLWCGYLDSFMDTLEGVDDGTYERQLREEHRSEQNYALASTEDEYVASGLRMFRRMTCVSCWYMGSENVGMWERYGGDFGVAITTTYGMLKKALLNVPARIWIGKVLYTDVPEPDGVKAVFTKSKCFEDEREFRMVIQNEPPNHERGGRTIVPDLRILFDAILISPFAPPWFEQVVKDDIRFIGFAAYVKPSQLTGRLRR